MILHEKVEDQMEILEDLLPGIEDFLSTVLAHEALSPYAEEQRQYFLERLDIIKLPPSIPPRPQSLGVRLYPTTSTPPPVSSKRHSFEVVEQDDFAAYQRELSRALVDTESGSPEHDEVKLYDDIEPTDDSLCVAVVTKQDEEESLYEIPQIKGGNLNDSGYEKAGDVSPVSKSVSCESLKIQATTPGRPLPPPLPPRKDRAGSDGTNRSSVGSILEDRTLDLTAKGSNIHRDMSLTASQNDKTDARSEKSSEDVLDTDDFDGLSCDSLDDAILKPKDAIIKLPKPVKKKSSQRHRLGQSMSSLREITQPFRLLEDVCLSGELHYKTKLSWSKKLVALTNGRLICYKYDRGDTKPTLVLLLVGYQATYSKKEGKKSYEILLAHDNFESHFFLSDFEEWAEMWCNYMNVVSEGKRAPGPYQHLARGPLIENSAIIDPISRSNTMLSSSNLSIASSDGFDSESGTSRTRKRDSAGVRTPRIGSFASKASQFFENFGKKSSVKKTLSGESDKSSKSDKPRPLSSATSQSSLFELISPMTPESDIVDTPLELKRHIKHQGFLDIYSSFNKRKWGKRWCMVHENKFECYRTQTSDVVELDFLLRTCILRRAVVETKSELGLMLMENNREKITIEPINWTELGSWLRILMKETATMVTPEGLEGYMDDSNPYHEATEITRLSDPFPGSPNAVSPTTSADRTLTNLTNDRHTSNSKRNRDSGNCSSESMDGHSGSLDRNSSLSNKQGTIPAGNIRRTVAPNTGDIYAQVCKVKGTSSNKVRKPSDKDEEVFEEIDAKARSKSENDLEHSLFLFDFPGDEHRPGLQQQKSLIDEIMSQVESQLHQAEMDDDLSDEGPEPFSVYLKDEPNTKLATSETNDVPKSYSDLVSAISPIKHEEEIFVDQNRTKHFLSSSVLGELVQGSNVNQNADEATADASCAIAMPASTFSAAVNGNTDIITCNSTSRLDPELASHKTENTENDKTAQTGGTNTIGALDVKHTSHQHSNIASVEGKTVKDSHEEKGIEEDQSSCVKQSVVAVCVEEEEVVDILQELRKRLVELKKERIHIKERKEKASSQVDKEFLEAEYRRLDRECQKVTDEITYMESSHNSTAVTAQKLDCIPEHSDSASTLADVASADDESKADASSATREVANDASVQERDCLSISSASIHVLTVTNGLNVVQAEEVKPDEVNVMEEFDKLIVDLESAAAISDDGEESKDLSSIEEEGTDSENGSRTSVTDKCGCNGDSSADGKAGCEICTENISIKELIDDITEEREAIQGNSVEYSICGSDIDSGSHEIVDSSVDHGEELLLDGANSDRENSMLNGENNGTANDPDNAEVAKGNVSQKGANDDVNGSCDIHGSDLITVEADPVKLEPNEKTTCTKIFNDQQSI